MSPKDKPLGFYMIDLKYHGHLDTPTMIGWVIKGRVHHKSSVTKVTSPSTIPILGSKLYLRVPMVGFKPPLNQPI